MNERDRIIAGLSDAELQIWRNRFGVADLPHRQRRRLARLDLEDDGRRRAAALAEADKATGPRNCIDPRVVDFLIKRRDQYLRLHRIPNSRRQAVGDVEATLTAIAESPAGMQAANWIAELLNDWFAKYRAAQPKRNMARAKQERKRRAA